MMNDFQAPMRKYPHIGKTRRASNFDIKSSTESIEPVLESSPVIQMESSVPTTKNVVLREESSDEIQMKTESFRKGRKSWLKGMFRFKKNKKNQIPQKGTSHDNRMSSFSPSDFGSSSDNEEQQQQDSSSSYEESSDEMESSMTAEEIQREKREEELRKWKGVLSAIGKYDREIINQEELTHMLELWELHGTPLEELRAKATEKVNAGQILAKAPANSGGVVMITSPTKQSMNNSRDMRRNRKGSSYELQQFDSSDEDLSSNDDEDGDSSSDDEEFLHSQMTQEEIAMEEQMKWSGVRSALRKFDSNIINQVELGHMLEMWNLSQIPLDEVRSRARSQQAKSNVFEKKNSSGLKLLQRGLGAQGVMRLNSSQRKKFKMNLGEINAKYVVGEGRGGGGGGVVVEV